MSPSAARNCAIAESTCRSAGRSSSAPALYLTVASRPALLPLRDSLRPHVSGSSRPPCFPLPRTLPSSPSATPPSVPTLASWRRTVLHLDRFHPFFFQAEDGIRDA